MGRRDGRWIKLPVWWIHKGIEGQSRGLVKGEMSALPGLREFKPTDRANSVAALKLYIILLARTNNQASDPGYATSSLSITEIHRATGLSREKIVSACRILEGLRLISVDRVNGATNTYTILGYKEGAWVKLPQPRFTLVYGDGDTLKQISTRSKAGLNALKLYLYLAASVSKETGDATRTYDAIVLNTGILRNEIKKAISMLINLELIVVEQGEVSQQGNDIQHSPNHYHIKGTGRRY